MATDIKIIGCGISGITTGICLLEAGYKVSIVAKQLPQNTTSAVAAAIWFPYQIMPQHKANEWSLSTYYKFEQLAQVAHSGVSMSPLKLYLNHESEAWWKKSFPEGRLTELQPNQIPSQFKIGYEAMVPISETHIYLNFLLNMFKELGGSVELAQVDDIFGLAKCSFAVINCTGLGARKLMNDREMYPIYGQIVKVDLQDGVTSITAETPVSDVPHEVAYIVRRSDCLVLGGTAIKGKETDTAENQYTNGIIQRCRELDSNLKEVNIQSVTAGLRPGRTRVRLERTDNIVHNYGHGGGGYTVSWGCAEEVVTLVNEIS
ncbi:MAG: FAD-dependent oxidoreductase [Bacteroidota bacterium]